MNKDIVILIPIYNPNEKITDDFLEILTKEFSNIVFINDGCNKEHDKFFAKLESVYPVFKHHINLGKGRGLKNGLNYILNNYSKSKVIVTADCDGQHSVEDIKKCAKVALENQDSLILGCRDFDKKDIPLRSKLGNKITRNILNLFVGESVSDTQTGLRAMSMDIARKLMAISGERYEYETNVLLACKNLNIPIKEVGIKTIYIDDNNTSHFNPVKDSMRIYKFFARYLIVGLIAYIIETLLFNKLLQIDINLFIGIPLFLLVVKFCSSIIKTLLNKHTSIVYTLISYIITSIVLVVFHNINIVLLKVGLDILLFLISILFININIITSKVSLK